MALEGTFKDFHVADIIQLIGLQRKTGSLTLEGGEDTLSILFQDGGVVWAQSVRIPWEQRMARLLVLRGLLTPAQLQQALSLQRETGKSLPLILVGERMLQERDWQSILTLEVEAAIYRPFRWTAGKYRFDTQNSVDVSKGKIGPLDTERLLMEGIRQVDEWPMILQKVPSPAAVFKITSPAGELGPKQVESDGLAMLKLMDGKRSVQELADASGLGEFKAWRCLAALVEAGAIESVDPTPVETRGLTPSSRLLPRLSIRPRLLTPTWFPRTVWGVAALWALLSMLFFHVEPLGVVPLSGSRLASLNRVRSVRALTDLGELARKLDRYAVALGAYPSGLEVLGEVDPSLVNRLLDPWGHPYTVRRTAAGIRVISGGPDGRVGTPDDLAVIAG